MRRYLESERKTLDDMTRRELRDCILEEQGGVCAVCGLTPVQVKERDLARGYRRSSAGTFVLDHDHANGFVRGVLCIPCNSALGSFGDNTDAMWHAEYYVLAYRQLPTSIPYR